MRAQAWIHGGRRGRGRAARGSSRGLRAAGGAALAALQLGLAASALGGPRVVVISLDGAQAGRVEQLLREGTLPRGTGLGRLAHFGAAAEQNVPATPSLTAVSHLALATGSTAVHNDVPSNSFHPVGAAIGVSLSGFAAPIGGYQLAPLAPSPAPTAEPLWVRARAAGHTVVTATWPGSEGADVRIAGALVQAAAPATRVTDYSVPFGAFGGLGAQGYALAAAAFSSAPAPLVAQLAAAGIASFSPPRLAALETVYCSPTGSCASAASPGALQYDLALLALDGANDGATAYDSLVVFDARAGIPPGPFAKPSTGPARIAPGAPSAPFYFEGSGNRVGTAFFAAQLAPDLSAVRVARYGASFIPRNPAVLSRVDDINTHVGFWPPQADFRIPERLSPGFESFSDAEVEALYRDQVESFVDYQVRVALHALERSPDADLLMVYIEQPDGSGHQFTLTDRRQASDPRDPASVGWPGFPGGARGQDRAKVERYAELVRFAYRTADRAVERIIQATGVERSGRPRADVLVVSDHGMAPFHSAVNLRNLLVADGIDPAALGLRTSGPAAHVYVNLAGREPGGTVSAADYPLLVERIGRTLRRARDASLFYNPLRRRLFDRVALRPQGCGRPGFCTDEAIGQDSGDVFAQLAEGYNFDGLQTPGVARLGDAPFDAAASVYSVPNFYGAHGYDSELESMSAILYAAGPDIRHGALHRARAIDLAPTALAILGVEPAPTVDGEILPHLLRSGGRD